MAYGADEGDLDLEILDDTGAVVDDSLSGGVDTRALRFDAVDAGTYTVRVWQEEEGGVALGNTYALSWSTDSCPEDTSEPNDDAAGATALTAPGTLTDMAVCAAQPADDWFAITVPAGQQLTVDLAFATSDGDLDMVLYAADGTTELDRSMSTNDSEQVVHAAGAADEQVLVQVRLFTGGQGAGSYLGNTYELSWSLQ